MAIFNLSEVFGQLREEMAKVRKPKIDEAGVAAWVERLVATKADRAAFETVFGDLSADRSLTSPDLLAIAQGYNKGGKKPSSKAAALALIRKRFVEIVRFHAKNKVAEKVRPW